MADVRDRFRAGLRPALYGSLFMAILGVMALPMVRNATVAQARLEFLVGVAGTFVFIIALYACGIAEPYPASHRTSRWVLALVAALVIVVIATECFGT